MNGNYLIPANTKRGKLILGLFRPVDLGIFLSGVFITFILVMAIPLDTTLNMIISLAPGLICSALVAPIPYYHNVLNVIVETYQFFTERRRFVWKGWCFRYESKDDK